MIRALIWDVDGTLAETEEIHRAAFNRSFGAAGLPWSWDRATYRRLLRVTGGKERMAQHGEDTRQPLDSAKILDLHYEKTALYGEMIDSGSASLRPGVAALIQAASRRSIRNAIATTTSRPNVDALIRATLGAPAERVFDVIAAGDEVAAKKPAPDVYLLALHRLGLPAADCLAIEDSLPGLAAARAAGLRVLVTPSTYTESEDFDTADWVLPDLAAPLPAPLAAAIGRA